VTSSVVVLQAVLWEKLSIHDQIVIKNLKIQKMFIKYILYEFPYKR